MESYGHNHLGYYGKIPMYVLNFVYLDFMIS